MSLATKDERARLNFICETIQRGRKRPAKYKHYLKIPAELYHELRDNFIIDMENYYINETGFIEVDNDNIVTISFIALYLCEDLHRKIDHYLIKKLTGSYPIQRGGFIF